MSYGYSICCSTCCRFCTISNYNISSSASNSIITYNNRFITFILNTISHNHRVISCVLIIISQNYSP